MKRALRIFIRITTAPLVLIWQFLMLSVGLCMVFIEWLFENADRVYSYSDFLKDESKDYKNYWKGFFK